MKPIEAIYNGYRFRSRLEARWAVFFDELKIEYKYEVEGFDIDGDWYLPDFWMPEWNCWVEIKPDIPKLHEYDSDKKSSIFFQKNDYKRCQKLAEGSGKIVMLVGGSPWVKEDDAHKNCHEYGITLFCPDMILLDDASSNGIKPGFCLIDRGDCGGITEGFFALSCNFYGFVCRKYENYPDFFDSPLPARGDAKALIEADKTYFMKKNGYEHPRWYYGITSDKFVFQHNNDEFCVSHYLHVMYSEEIDETLRRAYRKARQARFEHGESPI